MLPLGLKTYMDYSFRIRFVFDLDANSVKKSGYPHISGSYNHVTFCCGYPDPIIIRIRIWLFHVPKGQIQANPSYLCLFPTLSKSISLFIRRAGPY